MSASKEQPVFMLVQDYISNLRTALLEYKEKRSNLSWRAISKHSGVNRYFISKVIDDDGVPNASKIFDLTQALLLQSYLSEKTSISDTIDALPEPFRSLMSRTFKGQEIAEAQPWASKRPFKYLPEANSSDVETFVIMLSTMFRYPIKKDTLVEILGEKSLDKIEDLIDQKLIIEDKEGHIGLIDKDVSHIIPHEMLPVHIPQLIEKFYKIQNRSAQKNMLFLGAESVSEEASQKLYDMYMEFFSKIYEFVETAEAGPVPLFMFGGFERFSQD